MLRQTAVPYVSWLSDDAYIMTACTAGCTLQKANCLWPLQLLTDCLLVVKIHLTGVFIKDNILQDCAKLDGTPDLRLILPLQVDALGITTPLNVEHTIVTPAVLIITYQRPSLVC